MVKSFWSRRITIGAVFIMLLLNGCGNNPAGQNVTEDPEDIESLTDATPVTADEYGKYIEKQLSDVIAEQLNFRYYNKWWRKRWILDGESGCTFWWYI